jgi:hypothetical protein
VASWRCKKNSVFSDFYCLPNKLELMGLRPVFFGACTLLRGAPAQNLRQWFEDKIRQIPERDSYG